MGLTCGGLGVTAFIIAANHAGIQEVTRMKSEWGTARLLKAGNVGADDMNLEGLVCSKSQRRFAFVILKKLWKVLMLLLSVVLCVQAVQYCGRMMPDVPFDLRCRRCVVVGNSNSIRGRGLGAVIDSHNIVIRLNNAPVKEHKEDVGEKTSIRLFFPESALPNPLDNNNNETLMVLIAFKSLDFTWVKEMLLQTKNKTVEGFWRRPPSEWKWNAFHLRILHPYVTYEATYKLLQLEKTGGKYSTTGIIALNLALHICHEVNIVGFGYPDKGDNTTPVHYYDTEHLSQDVFVTHNISAEQAWLLKMMEQGMISDLLRPSSWSWGP
ncbi:hypothetical protein KIL84_021980 [Mauremys mutica]|uniref:Uncharacterized protein n=1 Tax=Mauremys mutica TaxID=74926 RepID=A0A9D4AWV5_9SAUR|nr:hypothetical protein KIL84_021980 [Mauremys mutica]